MNITYAMKQRLKLGIWLQEKIFVENINIIEQIGWLGEQKSQSSKLLEKKMFLNLVAGKMCRKEFQMLSEARNI